MKYLMEQNSVMVENMDGKSTNGNYDQPAETSLLTTTGQRVLTPEISSLITSVKELPIKIFEMLKMGKETGNDIGMDKSPESASWSLNFLVKLKNALSMYGPNKN